MTYARTVAQKLQRFGMVVALLVALPSASEKVSAQIYEWVDAGGDRHFETSLKNVPEEQRSQARIVVNASATNSAAGTGEGTSAPADTEPSKDDTARVDPFESGWDAGFRAGWDAGYRSAVDEQPECPAQPVVVMESRPPVVISVPSYDPTGAYYQPPFDGTLAVPFDDGASRGFTSRGMMQQRRALERGW
jgi:hypothetical protein